MEDAATAEICRAQVWQWLRHGAVLEDGRTVTDAWWRSMMDANVEKLHKQISRAAACHCSQDSTKR